MQINELTGVIVDICIKVHSKVGPGCFERVYEEILYYELCKIDIYTER
jgi:GxxExxY protein